MNNISKDRRIEMTIPDTFEEAIDYFDDHVFYEPLAKRTRYLEAVMKKFNVKGDS